MQAVLQQRQLWEAALWVPSCLLAALEAQNVLTEMCWAPSKGVVTVAVHV